MLTLQACSECCCGGKIAGEGAGLGNAAYVIVFCPIDHMPGPSHHFLTAAISDIRFSSQLCQLI